MTGTVNDVKGQLAALRDLGALPDEADGMRPRADRNERDVARGEIVRDVVRRRSRDQPCEVVHRRLHDVGSAGQVQQRRPHGVHVGDEVGADVRVEGHDPVVMFSLDQAAHRRVAGREGGAERPDVQHLHAVEVVR